MANSIVGINDDIISQTILEAFVAELTPLRAFSTSFNADAAKKGDRVSIMRTVVADAALLKVTHANYVIQDADAVAVEILLGQPTYVSWSLDDVEMASSSILSMERFAIQKGHMLAKTVLQDIWSTITAANFGTAAFIGAASTFDADDVADIKNAADAVNMPAVGRALVLSPAYYNALLKDIPVQSSADFGGSEAIRQGKIPMLMGMEIYMSNLIPGNAENLVGFVASSAGLAVATRYLQPQEGNKYHAAMPFSDPGTGLTLGFRDWYREDSGERIQLMECIWGKQVGIAAGLLRLTSA